MHLFIEEEDVCMYVCMGRSMPYRFILYNLWQSIYYVWVLKTHFFFFFFSARTGLLSCSLPPCKCVCVCVHVCECVRDTERVHVCVRERLYAYVSLSVCT
jgi:hypothetical protein